VGQAVEYLSLGIPVSINRITVIDLLYWLVVHPKNCAKFSGFSVVIKDGSYNNCSFSKLFNWVVFKLTSCIRG